MTFLDHIPTGAEWAEALPVIASLVVIEGLLSIDNALGIAAMVAHLPEKERKVALNLGIAGAYVMRAICLLAASFIIGNPWLKIAGAAYLIHLMASHFTGDDNEDGDEAGVGGGKQRGFWFTVLAVQFMDLSLSVDNVVAAVAMSPEIWVVWTGVLIGILALRFTSAAAIKMIEKYPILEDSAFLLIGYVGCLLLAEMIWHIEVHAGGKFAGIVVILGLSILYERQTWLRSALAGVLRVVRLPFHAYSFVVGHLLGALFWPVGRALVLGKRLFGDRG